MAEEAKPSVDTKVNPNRTRNNVLWGVAAVAGTTALFSPLFPPEVQLATLALACAPEIALGYLGVRHIVNTINKGRENNIQYDLQHPEDRIAKEEARKRAEQIKIQKIQDRAALKEKQDLEHREAVEQHRIAHEAWKKNNKKYKNSLATDTTLQLLQGSVASPDTNIVQAISIGFDITKRRRQLKREAFES